VKFSQTPGKVRQGAPVYGEHTRAILRDHGFGDEEIAALEAEGAVVAFSPDASRQKVA
jgi:crotonobetainyl-CoA:carnitine CoA-transferase CaiB-like acyl-CoA transferase